MLIQSDHKLKLYKNGILDWIGLALQGLDSDSGLDWGTITCARIPRLLTLQILAGTYSTAKLTV